MSRKILSLGLLAASLPVLSGCVAALIPVAAGGAMLGKDRLAPKAESRPPTESPTSDEPSTDIPAEAAVLPDRPIVDQASTPVAELPVASADTVETGSFAPVSQDQVEPAVSVAADIRVYDMFYSYVSQQARRDPVDKPRQSAVLAAPGALSTARTECSIRPPAVLIDLDHGDETFSAAAKIRPNPALAQMLASLRLQEIEVFWISQLAAVRAGEVRKILIDSGMDPRGRDGLLLMRRSDDRKQTRRKELSETHCLLAIAGDQRADFDELYLYLKDRTAAQPLEELVGSGWFLTPIPLSEGQSR